MGIFDVGAAGHSIVRGRLRATPRVSGTARAVRLALALSGAALAMSGSNSALAAITCAPPAPTTGDTVTCSGADVLPVTFNVDDLTVTMDATVDLTTNSNYAVSLTGTGGSETLYNDGILSNTGPYTVQVSTSTPTGGDVTVVNSNGILAYGGTIAGTTYGVQASSYDGDIGVTNQATGYINVYNSLAGGTGIEATSSNYGDVTVTNDGSIYVSPSGTSYGIYAASDLGLVHVYNTGSIISASGNSAYGIYAHGYYNVFVDNSGYVQASSTGSDAYGVQIYTCDCTTLDANLDNSGTIVATTTSGGDAYGVYIYSYDGNTNVSNDGYIDANANGGGLATGIYVNIDDGDTSITGAGTISAYGYQDAYGIHVDVDGDGSTTIDLYAGSSIDVDAYVGTGTGIYVAGDGYGDIHVGNAGSIDVAANQYAAGVHAYTNYDGTVDIVNSGTVTVTSTLDVASGLFASSFDGDASVDNTGTITVTAYGFAGDAIGINAIGDYAATVTNTGVITVDAQGVTADANGIMIQSNTGPLLVDSSGTITVTADDDAHGIDVFGDDGVVHVYTAGSIDVTGGTAYGIQLGVYGDGDVYIYSDAYIHAYANGFGSARGIDAHAYYGDVLLDNTGDIYAYAAIGDGYGIHVDSSMGGNLDIGNDGDITVYGNDTYGIYAQSDGDVTVTSTGAIDLHAYGTGSAYGIYVTTGAGAVDVDNSGAITATTNGLGSAFGIYVNAYGVNTVDVNNDAAIVATALGAPGGAIGIYVQGNDGAVSITSAGAITAQSYASATGILAYVNGDGSLYISHSDIDATSDYFYASGVWATTNGAGGVTVVGAGDVTVDGPLGAWGINAYTTGSGSVDVSSSGSISVTSDGGAATGVRADSAAAGASVHSTGNISATSNAAGASATGIDAYGYSNAYVYSSGNVTAHAYGAGADATGITATSNTGDVLVTGNGTVDVYGDNDATGIHATVSQDGYVYVYTGDVTVTAVNGQAVGVEAYTSGAGNVAIDGYGDVTVSGGSGRTMGLYAAADTGTVGVYSAGSIDVSAGGGDAYGIYAYSVDGDVDVTSYGSIAAYASASAYGVFAGSFYGNVYVDSTGAIAATGLGGSAIGIDVYGCDCYVGSTFDVYSSGAITANAYGANGDAYGIYVYAYAAATATVTSTASIIANAYGANGGATGIYATASDGALVVDSSGSITVYGQASSYGVNAIADGNGSVSVTNDGGIDLESVAGDATGIYASAYADVYVGGDGDIGAYAATGQAAGIFAAAYVGNAIVIAGGAITASSYGNAYGIHAQAYQDGYVDVTAGGAIDVDVASGAGYGIFAHTSNDGDVTVNSTGGIDVLANSGGYGIHALSAGAGSVDVGASGNLHVYAYFNDATGIYAHSYGANTRIDVTGGSVYAGAQYGNATGVDAYASGNAHVNNDGFVSVYAGYGNGTGIFAAADTGYVLVQGTGNITANAYGVAYGVHAETYADGYVNVTMGGAIVVNAYAGTGYGVFATTGGLGDVNVDVGDVSVYGTIAAYGVKAFATGAGSVYVLSAGDIDVGANAGAIGILANAYNASAYVDATGGSIVVSSDTYFAYGIRALGYDNAVVDNAASVDVYGYLGSVGVQARADGDASLVNSGAIDVVVGSYLGLATGLHANALNGDAYLANTGAVSVHADGAYASAGGIDAHSSYGAASILNSGDVDVTGSYAVGMFSRAYLDVDAVNSGDISAVATGQASAIVLFSDQGDIALDNSGALQADGAKYARGIYASASGGDAAVDNSGDIDVASDAEALGLWVYAAGDVQVYDSGDIAASAGGAGATDASAIGAYARGYAVDFATSGGSAVSAVADAYYATAIGVDVDGGYGLALELHGDIDAGATGFYGQAIGVRGSSYVDVLAYNGGDIHATFTGEYGSATGVRLYSLSGSIVFYNFGDVYASADYLAVGVDLDAGASALLFNQGTIGAHAASGNALAVLTGDGDDLVLNHGTINGPVVTGAGDDALYNYSEGVWNATGSSDFGDGDDTVTNYGLIYMSDAVIDLGLPGADGNAFCNYGTIFVSGDNIIDMEGGSAAALMDAALAATPGPLVSSNPIAFYNYNLIDFQDGSPTDTLRIIGDFGGPDGSINVDVSGLNGTGDLLYIEGDVLSDTVQTINVDMVDMPADGPVEVPVVEVSGNSVAGNFVLGSVDYSPIPFLTTNFSLVSHINTSSPDMFSLRVDMGVGEDGAIAADLPAGVQLLINDVVGSWHKRQGGYDDQGGKKFSLWGRLYHNKGKVDPDFDSDTIGDGEFGFEQKNYGGEAGFDFAPTGKWNFGIMLGKANADQDLRVGLGSDKIEGNVAGGYGTYHLPRGFYIDLSHRRMNFDAVVHTRNGNLLASGRAEATNAESGYSFNFHGFEFEGQLQVTHTKLVSLDNLVPDSSYSPPSMLAKGAATMAAAAPAQPVEFDNDADIATTTRAGWDIRKKYKSAAGTQWEWHATLNRIRMVGGQNGFEVTDGVGGQTDIGGDSSLLDVGFTARRGLLLMYGAVTWQDGGALQNFTGVQLGAKYTW
jgi:hypothetical protein